MLDGSCVTDLQRHASLPRHILALACSLLLRLDIVLLGLLTTSPGWLENAFYKLALVQQRGRGYLNLGRVHPESDLLSYLALTFLFW